MTKLLKLTGGFEAKQLGEEETLIIEGFANTTDKDRDGDVILESAWTMGGMTNFLKNPIVLGFHRHDNPIGKVLEHSVSSRGLFVRAEISKSAGRIFNLIKEGIVKTFSVGFNVKDADFNPEADVFVIKDLELFEISVVSVPANQDSVFSVAKQLGDSEDYTNMKKKFNEELDEEDSGSSISENTDLEDKIETLANSLATLTNKIEEEKNVKEKEPATPVVETGETSADKLQKAIDDRVASILKGRDEADTVAQKKAAEEQNLADMKSQILEQADELEALRKSKMSFKEKGAAVISPEDQETAVMISKIMKTPIEETKFGKALIQKAGSTGNVHIPTAEWEDTFSTRLFDDIRLKLIVSPLFRQINMTSLNLHIPINPDPAANATWVQRSAFGSATSSGTAVTTALSEVILSAEKLACHEFLIDEEEEDAIIAVAPVIRDSMARRMGRTWDKALLTGLEVAGDPINGLAKVAADAGNEVVLSGTLATAKVTVTDLQAVRRLLGDWGLDPMDLVYVVSTDAYFDLLEDADFRTIDLVGVNNATILKGEVGMVNGSRVIFSGEFDAKAVNVACAHALNITAFLVGTQRTLRFERDRQVIEQQDVLTASTRVGFANLIAGFGTASLLYPAS